MYQLPQAFAGLTAFPQFVVSELKPSLDKLGNQKFKPNGKPRWDKIPCDDNGNRLGWSKQSLLLTYQQAIQRLAQVTAQFPTRHFNLGYIFTETDGYAFLDLDDCYDAVKGWSQLALDILALLPGAAVEVSSSGSGLHIVYRTASAIKNRCKNKNWTIELYCGKKFMMFGQPNATGDCNIDHTKAHAHIISQYQLEQVHSVTTGIALASEWKQFAAILPQSTFTTKQEILKLLFRIKKPKTFTLDAVTNEIVEDTNWFEQLYHGDISNYESMSESDYAFVGEVLWASGNNIELTEQIWLESGLAREKLERMDYVRGTILKLRRNNPSVYVSNYRAQNTAPSSTSQGFRYLIKEEYLLTGNHKLANSVENFRRILTVNNIETRWNLMSHGTEVKIPSFTPFKDDIETSILTKLTDIASHSEFHLTRIGELLVAICQENPYHPIVESIQLKPWDGIPRLMNFLNMLKTDNEPLRNMLVTRWMVSAIAGAHSERGFAQHGVLVLQGPQYIGKTGWVKLLDIPGTNSVREAATINPTDKDSLIALSKYFISELGELDGTFRSTEMARLKSYTTAAVDEIRVPYGRKSATFPRRSAFIGTVNHERYLQDETGNRRWWTVPLTGIDFSQKFDIQQVWAEVYDIWQKGMPTSLNREEMQLLNHANESHEAINPIEEKLLDKFNFCADWEQNPLTLSMIKIAEYLGYDKPSKSDLITLGVVLKKYAKKHKRTNTGYLYLLPQTRVVGK